MIIRVIIYSTIGVVVQHNKAYIALNCSLGLLGLLYK